MKSKTGKAAIRLNENELRKAALDKNLKNNIEIAEAIGISVSQFQRVILEPGSAGYSSPGPDFVAGVLQTFGEPFERFFFLE